MSDCQLKGPDNCPHITINNESYNSQKLDENDCDADTIRISSFEFWNGVDADNDPDIPQNLILSESTAISTYGDHPGCQSFNCAWV